MDCRQISIPRLEIPTRVIIKVPEQPDMEARPVAGQDGQDMSQYLLHAHGRHQGDGGGGGGPGGGNMGPGGVGNGGGGWRQNSETGTISAHTQTSRQNVSHSQGKLGFLVAKSEYEHSTSHLIRATCRRPLHILSQENRPWKRSRPSMAASHHVLRPIGSITFIGSPSTYPYRLGPSPLNPIGSLLVHLPTSAS